MYAGGCGHTTEEYGKFMAVVRMRKQWCQAISQKRPLDSWKVALFPTLDGCASCIYLSQPVCRLPPATSASYLSREMLQARVSRGRTPSDRWHTEQTKYRPPVLNIVTYHTYLSHLRCITLSHFLRIVYIKPCNASCRVNGLLITLPTQK